MNSKKRDYLPFPLRGFTFVEVIFVITMISILTTIASLVYPKYISGSRDVVKKEHTESIAKAFESKVLYDSFTTNCDDGTTGIPFQGSGSSMYLDLCYGEINKYSTGIGVNFLAKIGVKTDFMNSNEAQIYKYVYSPKSGEIQVATTIENKDGVFSLLPVSYAADAQVYYIYSTFKKRDGMYGLIPLNPPNPGSKVDLTNASLLILTDTKQIGGGGYQLGGNSSPGNLNPPALTSPANNASNITTSPSLKWTSSSGATMYRVYVGTMMGTWNVHNGASTALTEFNTTVASGATYYWTVSACDLSDQCSAKASIRNFTTTGSSNVLDLIPDNFTFTDVTNASTGTLYTSNNITLSGITPGQSASFAYSGMGNLLKNGVNFGSAGATGTGTNGDVFAISLTTGLASSATYSGTLAFGGVSDAYGVTTKAAQLGGPVGPWTWNANATVKCRYFALNGFECDWSNWIYGGGLNYQSQVAGWTCAKNYTTSSTGGTIDTTDSSCGGSFLTYGNSNAITMVASDGFGSITSQPVNLSLPSISGLTVTTSFSGFTFNLGSLPNIMGDYTINFDGVACQKVFANGTREGFIDSTDGGCGPYITPGMHYINIAFVGGLISDNFSIDIPPIPAPTLVAPANSATGVSIDPIHTWNPMSGVAYYFYTLGTDTGATNMIGDNIYQVATNSFKLSDYNSYYSQLIPGTKYYWGIKACINSGYCGTRSIRSFTTQSLNLISPANTATGVSLDPMFTWSSVSGATSYTLSYGTDFDASNVSSCGGTATGILLSNCGGTPINATTYFWKVSTDNGNTWSSISSFTTQSLGLISPANSATGVSLDPTFTWSTIPGYGYYFAIGTNTGADNLIGPNECVVYGTDISMYTSCTNLKGLVGNTKYFWKVSLDGANWSSISSFTTKNIIFTPLAPAHTSTGVSLNPTFTWTNLTGAYQYDMTFGTNSGGTNITDNYFGTGAPMVINGGTTTSGGTTSIDYQTINSNYGYNLPNLTLSGTYFWKIRVCVINSYACEPYSSVQRFATKNVSVTPLAPAHTSTGVSLNPTFTWTNLPDAYQYDMTFGTNSGGTNITDNYFGTGAPMVINGGTTTSGGTTSIDYQTINSNYGYNLPNLTLSGTYFWKIRVCVVDSSTCGPYSSVQRFATKNVSVTPLAPAHTSTGVSLNPTFTWTNLPDAYQYDMTFGTNSGGTNITDNYFGTGAPMVINGGTTTSGGTTSIDYQTINSYYGYNLPNLTFSGTYYWKIRVCVVDSATCGPYSSVQRFATQRLDLTFPANSSTGVTLDPTFTWNGSPTGNYYFAIGTDAAASNIIGPNDCSITGTGINIATNCNNSIGLLGDKKYFWRVSGDGGATWSAISNFTTRSMLTFPANSSTGVTLDPTFTWNGSPTGNFLFAIGTGATANDIIGHGNCGITGTGINIATNCSNYIGLVGDKKYFWKVSGDGGATWSAISNFTTRSMLTFPVNSSTGVVIDPTFTWNGSPNGYYLFALGTDTAASNIILPGNCGITGTGIATNASSNPCSIYLWGGVKYYWKVSPDNGTTWSAISNFTTQNFSVTPLTPVHNSTGAILNPTFAWTSFSGAYQYQITIGTDTAGVNITDANLGPGIPFTVNAPTTSIEYISMGLGTLPTLNLSTPYYWKVRVCIANGASCGQYISPQKFTTGNITQITTLTPLTPAQNATNVNIDPRLSWTPVYLPPHLSLTSYEYYIGTGSSYTNVCSSTFNNSTTWNGTTSNSINSFSCDSGTVFLSPLTTYNWGVRVRYTNTNNGTLSQGPLTSTGTFTTQAPFGGTLVRDIWSGTTGSSGTGLTLSNGTLFFSASNGTTGTGSGIELWKSDGTDAGTVMVRNINAGTASSSPANLTNVSGTLFFSASNGTTGTGSGVELWKSDGTTAGTVMVKDIRVGSGSSSPANLTNVNGTLFFSATNGTAGIELWKSDGTDAGTVMVRDIYTGSTASITQASAYFTAVGNTLYFVARSSAANNWELWKSDGTNAGTVMVKDINPGTSVGSTPQFLTNVNGTLYFTANDGTTGIELWKSDGTNAGTVMVKDIYYGSSSDPTNLTNVNGTLYFTANTGVRGVELWTSNGTAAGTVMVTDINPIGGSSSPANLTNVNGTLFFTADNGTLGRELWKY